MTETMIANQEIKPIGNGQFSGADWLLRQLICSNPCAKLSPLGIAVADFLGELYRGIYHLDHRALYRADWENNNAIVISIGYSNWATVDYDTITRLVFLAHHMALRVEMEASTHDYMRLIFSQRSRSGDLYQRCPTIENALEDFNNSVSVPKYGDFLAKAVQP